MQEQTFRAMKDISLEERKNILLDAQIMKPRDVREKYNITNGTLSHIKFVHGRSNAIAGGYYHKDLLQGEENSLVKRIRDLKNKGMNSLEVAREMKVDLALVNRNWVDKII